MPMLETPDELAEAIADLVGVYDGCANSVTGDCRECKCRIEFVDDMTQRIREAVKNERLLKLAAKEGVQG